MSAKHSKVLVGLTALGSVLMLLAFSRPWFQGAIYLEHDISANFVPLRYFFAQCLQQGESYLWTSNIHSGFYLFADGQNGMAHPLHLFLYKYFSFTTALDLEFILNYPIMFMGMLLFLKRLQFPLPSVLFGAMLFTFSGYCLSSWLWLVHIGVIAHTPWVLWAIHIVMRSEKPRDIVLASFFIVLLTTSALLVGYPQMVYVMGMAEGFYALSLLRGCSRRWTIGLLLVAKILGFFGAAIQVLPTLDLLDHSLRSDTTYAFRMAQSLHPYNLLSLVNPYLFHQRMYEGNGYQGLYGGTTVTLLAVWVSLRIRRLTVSRYLVATCVLITLIGLILTLGQYGYLYRWLSALPVLSSFRGPPRHGAMFHLGWILLATLAFSELMQLRQKLQPVAWREMIPLIGLTLISIGAAVFIAAIRMLPEIPEAFAFYEIESAPTRNPIVGALLMTTALGAFIAAARGWRYGMVILLLVTMGDLSTYHLRHFTTDTVDHFIAELDVPPDDTYGYEPDWLPMYSVNAPLMKGNYRTPEGLISLTPHKHIEYLLNPTALRLAGVGWIRARHGTNAWLDEAFAAGIEWIPLEDPMPRARFVTQTQVSDDFNRDIYTTDMAQVALVSEAIPVMDGRPGIATILDEGPGRFTLHTETDSRQLLVLTESYSPGWQITSDGKRLEPIPVYGDFLGCLVELGEHDIDMKFYPDSYRNGVFITWLSLGIALLGHLGLFVLLKRYTAKKENHA